jgi:succinate dehydrogenase flavin-adding protein (antitoxin of CptAB toxin-antitoxin module)
MEKTLMALSHIQPRPPQSPSVRERDTRGVDPGKARDALPNAPLPSDRVLFSRQTAPADLKRILVERIMTRTEMESTSATRDLFAAAGKAEFDQRGASAAAETSPEATAARIVEGATGYIFKAYRTRQRGMTEGDFVKFQDQVLRGFSTGVEDAKDIFAGLQAMTPEVDRWIAQTESVARQRLGRFFEEVRTSLRQTQKAGQAA